MNISKSPCCGPGEVPRPSAFDNLSESPFAALKRNFRIAAQEYGHYCPVRHELRVPCNGRIFCIRCGEGMLHFKSPWRSEADINIASDATVAELRWSIFVLIGSAEEQLDPQTLPECAKAV